MSEASLLTDALRSFWLPGLNDVSGRCIKDLKAWINDGEFQVYSAPTENSFVLSASERRPLLQAFAAEISRISIASQETMASIALPPVPRKSTAWLIIQTYYAAFFAAHCIVRLLGTSCFPIEGGQLRSIEKIAALFGYTIDKSIGGGLYRIDFDVESKQVRGTQMKSMKAGPHEAFWNMFADIIQTKSTALLTNSPVLTSTAQSAAAKLAELLHNLKFDNSAGATWLSKVRNSVNYEHRWAAWYPYPQRYGYYDSLLTNSGLWRSDPMDVELSAHDGKELLRFQATCSFIIALCRDSIEDMARRCSTGKSFHDYGTLAFRSFLSQRHSLTN